MGTPRPSLTSAHPGAKKDLPEIRNAEDRRHALDAVKAFEAADGANFPKAVSKITDDVDELLAFYDFPAQHWVHLRTSNPGRGLRSAWWTWLSPGSSSMSITLEEQVQVQRETLLPLHRAPGPPAPNSGQVHQNGAPGPSIDASFRHCG